MVKKLGKQKESVAALWLAGTVSIKASLTKSFCKKFVSPSGLVACRNDSYNITKKWCLMYLFLWFGVDNRGGAKIIQTKYTVRRLNHLQYIRICYSLVVHIERLYEVWNVAKWSVSSAETQMKGWILGARLSLLQFLESTVHLQLKDNDVTTSGIVLLPS